MGVMGNVKVSGGSFLLHNSTATSRIMGEVTRERNKKTRIPKAKNERLGSPKKDQDSKILQKLNYSCVGCKQPTSSGG